MRITKLRIIIILILTGVLVSALVQTAYSKERKGYHPAPTLTAVSNNWMQVNNVNTIFRSDGYFNYDKITFPGGEAGMIWPVSDASRKTIDFTTGIFVGGKVNGQIRLAASLYNTHYTPGNIPVVGQVPPNSVCSDPRFKMYQVNLVDPSLINGGTKVKNAGGRNYTITYDSWASWPVDLGAAYVEVNGIPGYQPDFNGDRPGIGNSTTRPDEILWCTFMDYTNCTNSIHYSEISLPGGTLPIGVEIQQTSFAYLSPGLVDMYFVKWKVINRSSNNWDSTYIGVVNDPDIGDAFDDAAGCDSAKSVGFAYNFDNTDPIYGDNPPAVGFKYLQGPVVYTGDPNDTAKLPYITLVGYKQLGMSGFNVFANGLDVCLGDPDEGFRAYYFLRGQNGCGVPLYNWAYNYPTKYAYNGSLCPPSGWYDSTLAQDRRFIQSSGPFVMESNDTQIVTVGVFCARSGNNYQSVCQLLDNSQAVQKFYSSNFAAIPLPPLPSVSVVADGDGKIVLYWGTRSEAYNQYDSLGNTGAWRFEGYNIYQIKPGTGGDNESDRSLLATYDLINNITTVYDTLRVLQPDGSTKEVYKPVAFGDNYNVSHHIVLTKNKYPTGVNDFFINGQTYKFSVTAYGVNLNAGKPFKVLENPVSGAVVTVIPNFNIMGTEIIHKKFDTLSFNKPDRVLFPVVLDPLKVKSATYKFQFRPDNTFNVFRVMNSTVDTLIRGANNVGLADSRAQIADGILFRTDTIARIIYGVVRDPSSISQSKNFGWTYTGNRNLQGYDTTGINISHPSGNYKAMQSLSMGLSWVNGQVLYAYNGMTTSSTFRSGFSSAIDTNFIKTSALKKVKITFGQTQKAYRYRGLVNNSPYVDFVDIPFKVEIDDPVDTAGPPRQVNVGFYDYDSSGTWNPKATPDGGLEQVLIFYSTYSETALPFYAKNIGFLTQFRQLDIQYVWWPRLINAGPAFSSGDVMTIVPYTKMQYQQSPGHVTTITLTPTTAATIGSLELAKSRNELEMVRVVPNPYYGGHAQETSPFDRFVKFMNLPKSVTIYIYSLNGNLVRQLSKDGIETSLNWDLLNTDRIPVASGIYIAYIDAPGIGSKIIKIAVFTPEERLDTF